VGVGVVEEEEFDVCAGEEAGDVVVVVAVYVFEIPAPVVRQSVKSCFSVSRGVV